MVQKSAIKKFPLLIIAGPTGVGKTKLALELYDKLNATLISADSMQIYKNCNIGTAKLSDDLLDKYPHYNINIKTIEQEYSVAEFKENTNREIAYSIKENKLPIIVGGTGLYIEGLIFPYEFANCPKNEGYRAQLDDILNTQGKDKLYEMLLKIDPETAKKISVNDVKKIKRILEICHCANTKLSQIHKIDENFENSPYDYFIVFLTMERNVLYDIINNRVDDMIKEGLVDEAKFIYETQKRLNKNLQVSNAIGYKELFDYFDGKITLKDSIDKIKQHSRNYAKRQITWFKRYKKNIIFAPNQNTIEHNAIVEFLLNKYNSFAK